mgnify:CR=1 FL=1
MSGTIICGYDIETEGRSTMGFLEGAAALHAELGVPCAPVYEAYEAMWDPHLEARGMWVEVDHRAAGRHKVPNFPVKFSETLGEVTSAAPMLGQHTREVLKELLGKTDGELDELEKQGAIVQWKG